MEMVPLSGSIKEAIMDKSVDFPAAAGTDNGEKLSFRHGKGNI